jgi:hypothetical protein
MNPLAAILNPLACRRWKPKPKGKILDEIGQCCFRFKRPAEEYGARIRISHGPAVSFAVPVRIKNKTGLPGEGRQPSVCRSDRLLRHKDCLRDYLVTRHKLIRRRMLALAPINWILSAIFCLGLGLWLQAADTAGINLLERYPMTLTQQGDLDPDRARPWDAVDTQSGSAQSVPYPMWNRSSRPASFSPVSGRAITAAIRRAWP